MKIFFLKKEMRCKVRVEIQGYIRVGRICVLYTTSHIILHPNQTFLINHSTVLVKAATQFPPLIRRPGHSRIYQSLKEGIRL